MKQLNNFNERVTYVSPSCKSVELRSCQTILAGSNYEGRWHTERLYDDGEEIDL